MNFSTTPPSKGDAVATPWQATFIATDEPKKAAPAFRREFELQGQHGAVVSATLLVSALGVCEAFVNGRPVATDVLTPGWSSYEWRVRYAEYDVAGLLEPVSAIGLVVGNGWYRGRLGIGDGAEPYGDELGAFAELRITYSDGHIQIVATDSSWRSGPSAIVSDDLYDGQSIDARLRVAGWDAPGFDDTQWATVHPLPFDTATLEPFVGPPVQRQERRRAEDIWDSPSGAIILDFGQNLVGWVELRLKGEAGTTLTLRHAEVIHDGELCVTPLRTAQATDRFTLSGGDDLFEPTFTLHGFRYVEVSGWPADRRGEIAESLRAVVVASTLEPTGSFRCSDPLLTRFHENVQWSTRGNFVSIPTDCPQRDERLGWTGDLAVFAPTAAFLVNCKDFLRDWLRDLRLEQQHADGVVPLVVPNLLRRTKADPGFGPIDATAIWGDAAVWVPWALWEAFGDEKVLSESFDSMLAHVRRIAALLSSNGLWDTGFQFGDWLDPDAPADQPWAAKADVGVVATACAFRSATMTANAATLLGFIDIRAELDELRERLRSAFHDSYVSGGRILSDAPTVYALAIAFDLLGDEDRVQAGNRLAELVTATRFHVSTGFAGTPFLLNALSSTGHVEEAYQLILQTSSPSWLYPVTMGATTVWERWDSMLPDGSINTDGMTSFNHYALGSAAAWIHTTVLGISPLEPGFARILLSPQPTDHLNWAEGELQTPHGTVSLRWELVDDCLLIDASVPHGSSAVLRLANREDRVLGPGNHLLRYTLGS